MCTTYVCNLDEDAKKYAKENLGETEDARNESITLIRRWLEDNPKLHARTDDTSILMFLRGCKFKIEKTKLKMQSFYTMRSEIPQWYENRDPTKAEIWELVKLGVFVPLRDAHDNRLVVIIRTAVHDPQIHTQDNVFKAGNMILDIAVKENEKASVYGIIALFDMKNVTLRHARQLPPHLIKKAVLSWQNYHCKPKQLEFVNAPTYINVMLSIFKSFMPEKLKKRVRVHFSGEVSLHEIISKDILPAEYGGNCGSLHDVINYWAEQLLRYRNWFHEDEIYKAEL